jgi:hypothetical protein
MEGPQNVIYNPYVMNLLYMRMTALRTLLARHYRGIEQSEEEMERAILNEHHATFFTLEVSEMERKLRETGCARFDLYHCNFEFFLWRLSLLLRTKEQPLEPGFYGRAYQCELRFVSTLMSEHYVLMQSLIHQYIEDFYCHASEAKVRQRVTLFLNLKETLEKTDNLIEHKDSMLVYNKECVIILILIYFLNSFMQIVEHDSLELSHDKMLASIELKPRGASDIDATSTTMPVTTTIVEHEVILNGCTTKGANLKILGKIKMALTTLYGELISVLPIKEEMPLPDTEKSLIMKVITLDLSLGETLKPINTTPTTTTSDDDDFDIKAYNDRINSIYRLLHPPSPFKSILVPCTTTLSETRSFPVNNNSSSSSSSSSQQYYFNYLPLHGNEEIYARYLYRLSFEARIKSSHNHCKKNEASLSINKIAKGQTPVCLLCDYVKFPVNTVHKNFCHSSETYNINNSYVGETEEKLKLHESLRSVHIQTFVATTAFMLELYNVLSTLLTLFSRRAMLNLNIRGESDLLQMIDPLALLQELSRHLIASKLEKSMNEVLALCAQKLGLPSNRSFTEKEFKLALQVELVLLCMNAVNNQQNEIQKYERSMTIQFSLTSTELHQEVIRNLKSFYVAYTNVLMNVMKGVIY